MVYRHDRLLDDVQNLLVGLDLWPREVFRSHDDWRYCLGPENFPNALVTCDRYFLIRFRAEPIGIDDWEVCRVG